jgi:hypothetical protein
MGVSREASQSVLDFAAMAATAAIMRSGPQV